MELAVESRLEPFLASGKTVCAQLRGDTKLGLRLIDVTTSYGGSSLQSTAARALIPAITSLCTQRCWLLDAQLRTRSPACVVVVNIL
eukprot:368449-Pyramimonas_sp.AAC.1